MAHMTGSHHHLQSCSAAIGCVYARQAYGSAILQLHHCSSHTRHAEVVTGSTLPRRSLTCASSGRSRSYSSYFSGVTSMHAATKRRPIARQRNQREVCWARAMSSQEACRVLGVDNTCSRQELRAAYMARIKEVHPDVNPALQSTDDAVLLNEAYAVLQLEVSGTGSLGMRDVFEDPEAEPSELFINPFACAIDPFMWRELQDVAKSGSDPLQALASQGLYIRNSAAYYLTPAQLAAIEAEMRTMEDSMSFEVSAWVVTDYLMRAARANERMPSPRRR